jgi:hypothetical protein
MATAPEATSLRFIAVARTLARAARDQELSPPAFRSPPRVVGLSRSLVERPDGHVTVAVLLRERPWAAVLADMVDGVVAANHLRGLEADRCRRRLWSALENAGLPDDVIHHAA